MTAPGRGALGGWGVAGTTGLFRVYLHRVPKRPSVRRDVRTFRSSLVLLVGHLWTRRSWDGAKPLHFGTRHPGRDGWTSRRRRGRTFSDTQFGLEEPKPLVSQGFCRSPRRPESETPYLWKSSDFAAVGARDGPVTVGRGTRGDTTRAVGVGRRVSVPQRSPVQVSPTSVRVSGSGSGYRGRPRPTPDRTTLGSSDAGTDLDLQTNPPPSSHPAHVPSPRPASSGPFRPPRPLHPLSSSTM